MKFQDIDAPNTNNPKKPNLVVILLYCNLVGAKSALSTVHTHSKRLTTKDLAKSGPFCHQWTRGLMPLQNINNDMNNLQTKKWTVLSVFVHPWQLT